MSGCTGEVSRRGEHLAFGEARPAVQKQSSTTLIVKESLYLETTVEKAKLRRTQPLVGETELASILVFTTETYSPLTISYQLHDFQVMASRLIRVGLCVDRRSYTKS